MSAPAPRPDETAVQDFWSERPMIHPGFGFDRKTATPEQIFAHVERLMRHDNWMQAEGQPLLSRFIDYEALRGKTVLDIGYGVGWLVEELQKVAAEVHGIDLSRSHFQYSSYRFRDNPRVKLQIASAEAIPFPDNHFDFVSAYGVLHHAADDQRCYDEVHRVLKPGGRCFLMVYRKGGPKYWYWKMLRQGLLGGGLARHGWNVEKFIYSVTDAYEADSPGAPISRHYVRADIDRLFRRFKSVRAEICGNRHEWDNLPAHRLPLTNWLLPRAVRDWLVTHAGAYWILRLEK